MNQYKKLSLPLLAQEIDTLKVGDLIYLSGHLYTARDVAHKRMDKLLNSGKGLPINIKNQALYYSGPCPARPGTIIGSCGPTTSSRMDSYTPTLLDLGLKIMIGKGQRSPSVVNAITRNKAVYLSAIGGTGALLSKCVKDVKIVAFEDLATEAIHKLRIKDFPAIVTIDAKGNDLFKLGPKSFNRL